MKCLAKNGILHSKKLQSRDYGKNFDHFLDGNRKTIPALRRSAVFYAQSRGYVELFSLFQQGETVNSQGSIGNHQYNQ